MTKIRHSVKKYIFLLLAIAFSTGAKAQGDPTDSLPGDPGAIYVYTYQNLKFGAFTQGASGGTVAVAPDGTRCKSSEFQILISVNINGSGIAW